MTRHFRISLSTTAVALLIVAAAPRASASGFQLREQGASGQGVSFAGISAGGSDISSMFFNPAALTRFDGTQLQVGFTNIIPSAEFSNGTANRAGSFPGHPEYQAISGPSSHGNAAQSAVTPTLYAMWSLSKDLKVGISVNVPYGLTTQYDPTWIGRYHAIRSHLETVDIAPTLAYRFNSQWSGGISFVARQAKAELSQAVDLGYEAWMGIKQIQASGAFPTFTNANPLVPGTEIVTPGSADGLVFVKGDSWAYGFKAGLLYEPSSTFRVGLGYQSAMSENVKGDVTFTIPSTVALGMHALSQVNPGSPALNILSANLATGTANGPVTADLKLPACISLGASYDVSSTFTLSAEFERTTWSQFKELRLKFSDPAKQADNVTNENWKDTTFVSVGATCKPGGAWTYRVGLALDKGAVEDAYRTPRIPDADRTWISAGLSYQFVKGFGIDLGLTHIMVKDSTVNLKGGTNPLSSDFIKGDLAGTYKNAIDIWALQARWSF